MIDESSKKEEFEEWAYTQGLPLVLDSKGNYMYAQTRIAWNAWKSRKEKE